MVDTLIVDVEMELQEPQPEQGEEARGGDHIQIVNSTAETNLPRTSEAEAPMNWSPIKRTGHKRSLEELEEGEVDSESKRSEDEESGSEGEEGDEQDNGAEDEDKAQERDSSASEGVKGSPEGAAKRKEKRGNSERIGSNGQRTVSDGPRREESDGTLRPLPEDSTITFLEGGQLDQRSDTSLEGAHLGEGRPIDTKLPQEWDNNNASGKGKQAIHPHDRGMANGGGSELNSELVIPHDEVIRETQFHLNNRNIYNDVLASIGLDNPTTSQETRRGNENRDCEFGQSKQGISTPIRNSASSLIALGKHVLTPRQGRIWETCNKSPLGGQGS